MGLYAEVCRIVSTYCLACIHTLFYINLACLCCNIAARIVTTHSLTQLQTQWSEKTTQKRAFGFAYGASLGKAKDSSECIFSVCDESLPHRKVISK